MWTQLFGATLGIWLMAAPGVLNYSGLAADNDHIAGPIAATFAIIACWEATRPVRWVNLPIGIWLVLAPWILNYASNEALVNDLIVGVLLAGTALFKGRITGEYGGGWSALWKSGNRASPEDERPTSGS